MVSVQEEALVEVPLQEEDSVEFRLLMSYAQRTLPNSKFEHVLRCSPGQKKDGVSSNGAEHAVGDHSTVSPKKEKKKRRWRLTPKCLQPPRDKQEKKLRSVSAGASEDVRVRGLVQRLAAIVRKVEKQDQEGVGFRGLRRAPSVQHDGDGEENLIAEIVAILRTEGDKLNEQLVQEQSFIQRLQSFWSYGFFQRLTETYVSEMVPATEAEEVQQSSRIAMCVHATTKLTTLDSLPMNRMFGFGARYLKENYSQWIKDHGGWEKVMGISDAQEEESEEE